MTHAKEELEMIELMNSITNSDLLALNHTLEDDNLSISVRIYNFIYLGY